MQTITRDQAKSMIQDGMNVEVIEVLSKENFDKFHLPGAKNVPIGEDFDNEIQKAVPDKGRAVLLYCLDAECEAAPKAAKKMEALGYEEIYEYEAGKVDWKEAGLPVEA